MDIAGVQVSAIADSQNMPIHSIIRGPRVLFLKPLAILSKLKVKCWIFIPI